MDKIKLKLEGLFKSGVGENLATTNGKLQECNNWNLTRGMLRTRQGTGSTSLTGTSTVNCMWHDGTDLMYIEGRNLKKATDTSVVSNLLAAGTSNRYPYDRFRKYVLIGTREGLYWVKSSGATKTARKAGMNYADAAMILAAGAAGALTGTYRYKVLFVNDLGHESNPSYASMPVYVYAQRISVTNIPVGPTGVVARKLYRTVAEGGLYLYVTTINDNSTTTYTDNTEDTALGIEPATDNTMPPTSVMGCCNDGKRFWIIDGTDGLTIRACKIDASTGEPNWEAYPDKLSVKIPVGENDDQALALFYIQDNTGAGTIFVACTRSMWRLDGDPASGTRVTRVADWGIFSPFAWCYSSDGVYMVTSDARLVYVSASQAFTEVGYPNIDGYLKAFTRNSTITDGIDHIELSWDKVYKRLHISYKTSGSTNTSELVMEDNQWSRATPGSSISLSTDSAFYIYRQNHGTFLGNQTTGTHYTYSAGLSEQFYTDQRVQTWPFMLSLSDPVYVGRVGLVVSTKPMYSNIPPTIKIAYALNGSSDFVEKYADLTQLNPGNTLYSAGGTDRRVIWLPIQKFCYSVALRITASANQATVRDTGVSIFEIFVEARQAKGTGNPESIDTSQLGD